MHYQDTIQILDLVDSGVIVLDAHQRIVYWNDFISVTSQIPLDQARQKHWLDLFPSLQGTRIEKSVSKAVDLGFPSILSHKLLKHQFPIYRKSLATKPPYLIIQSVIVKPLENEDGSSGCVLYINDVSAANKREKDLNEQSIELRQTICRYKEVKNQFEQVFANAHNAIIVFNDSGIIINANNAAAELFEQEQEALLNTNIASLLPDLKKLYFDNARETYQQAAEFNHEFEQAIKTSTQKHLAVSISQMNAEESDGNFFVFISDITKRKIAEEELVAANSELEEFAYRTSHDLRSPLVSSLGLIKVARESLANNHLDKVYECLEFAENSITGLEKLIQDILKLTEIRIKEEPPAVIDLPGLVESALTKITHLDTKSSIDKQVQLDYSGSLVAKHTRLNLIIENLVSNAAKYRDTNESKPYVRVCAKERDQSLIIDVSDNGLGIPPERRKDLFKMFKRFHPKIAFGSGLGLYLIKKSADALNARIEFIEQNKGCCFRLTLPLNHGSND
jgi:PAS domain S-box-containing protein